MNHAWILGRFSLISLVLAGAITTIGCEQPLSVLRMILAIQQPGAQRR